MRKISYISYLLHCIKTKLNRCMRHKPMIFANGLPMKAKMFIQINFPGHDIVSVEKKNDSKGDGYEVCLNDGTIIIFSKDGAWNKVDCRIGILPFTMIPKAIPAFLKTNNNITELNRTNNGYEVGFSNSTTMKLNNCFA